MATQNLLLMVYNEGLGACWINWTVSASNEKRFYERFDIPSFYLPICMVAIGYPEEKIKIEALVRKDLKDFVVYGRF